MKVYPTNNLVPVNSKQRQPESITIPVFNFMGILDDSSLSDKWYPSTNIKITGGYVATTSTGIDNNEFYILRGNIFEQNIEIGVATMAAGDNKSTFQMNNIDYQTTPPYPQANIMTPFDYLTIWAAFPSEHGGITVQIFGEKVN